MDIKIDIILDDVLQNTVNKEKDNPLIDQVSLTRKLDRYSKIYVEMDKKFCDIFSFFHYKFNSLFDFWNVKYNSEYGGHFNADQSRELISLIDQFRDLSEDLKSSSKNISISDYYLEIFNKIYPLLNRSGGSPIPQAFGKINTIKYDPIFSLKKDTINMQHNTKIYKLVDVGEGSYAIVKKYFDLDYNRWFAIKQAKKNLNEKELVRFRREYEILSTIKFPYILDVFTYDSENNAYTMEYCDSSLQAYIRLNNQKLSYESRKKIAMQFLYGVNFLYKQQYFHRDLSWNNILIKKYDYHIVFIKIADFGLVKEHNSDLTDSDTSGKGSTFHRDPLLESFKNVKVENEIYSIGCILYFIFTGKENLSRNQGNKDLSNIIDKCIDNKSLENRYHNIIDIIEDVQKLAIK